MGELLNGWSSKLLGEIATTITKGTTPTSIGYQFQTEGVPFVKVENIEKNRINTQSIYQFISNEAHFALSRSAFEEGDVLFSIAGTIGKTALVKADDLPCNTNQAVAIIRGTDKVLLPLYLKYNLSFRSHEIFMTNARGGAMNNVSLGDLKQIKIIIPPLAEQKRIVEKLDEVLAQVDTIKARLDGIPAILKRFRQSVLASAVSGKLTEEWRGGSSPSSCEKELLKIVECRKSFVAKRMQVPQEHLKNEEYPIPSSWKWTSLDALASKIVDGVHHKPVYVDEGIPFMSVKDIRGGKISFDNCKYISLKTHMDIHPRCNPAKGDLLITKSGTIGRTAIIKTDSIFDLFVSVALVKPASQKVNMEYINITLMHWVNSIDISSRVVGTAIKNLHLRDMRVLAVPFAPLDEQKEIVRLVDNYFELADTIEAQVKKAQARVDNLTQSILAKAFRGELVPQDPNDEPADKLLERIAQARVEAEALAKAAKKNTGSKKKATKTAKA